MPGVGVSYHGDGSAPCRYWQRSGLRRGTYVLHIYYAYGVEGKARGNARDIEYCFHGPLPVECSLICVSLFDERASSCAHVGVVDTQSGRELRARKYMRGHVSGIRECAGRGLPSGPSGQWPPVHMTPVSALDGAVALQVRCNYVFREQECNYVA